MITINWEYIPIPIGFIFGLIIFCLDPDIGILKAILISFQSIIFIYAICFIVWFFAWCANHIQII